MKMILTVKRDGLIMPTGLKYQTGKKEGEKVLIETDGFTVFLCLADGSRDRQLDCVTISDSLA